MRSSVHFVPALGWTLLAIIMSVLYIHTSALNKSTWSLLVHAAIFLDLQTVGIPMMRSRPLPSVDVCVLPFSTKRRAVVTHCRCLASCAPAYLHDQSQLSPPCLYADPLWDVAWSERQESMKAYRGELLAMILACIHFQSTYKSRTFAFADSCWTKEKLIQR